MSHEKLIHQQLLLSPSVKTSYVTRSLILDELEVLVPVIGTQTNVAYIRHQLLKWYCRPSSHYFLVGHSLYVTVYIYYIGLSVHLRCQSAPNMHCMVFYHPLQGSIAYMTKASMPQCKHSLIAT